MDPELPEDLIRRLQQTVDEWLRKDEAMPGHTRSNLKSNAKMESIDPAYFKQGIASHQIPARLAQGKLPGVTVACPISGVWPPYNTNTPFFLGDPLPTGEKKMRKMKNADEKRQSIKSEGCRRWETLFFTNTSVLF